ncbi:hypothetical protein HNQ07_003352 [Deinococcus metalli]|uniref:DUF402 domain-containing protein n=1 Tax=Deinococcus metalli TaxID=1141878 RepID=A0A7W8KGT4_9DEIO|nr:DUF402 domain-containing protein [Deinococcus metalli]MBB5377852.1 hypothetical protein [Deinococcus metalli]GHF55474.1 hypothetical protein GCM10017781_34810 [Deinococcus metalli]
MKRKVFDLRPWARVARHTQTVLTLPGYVIVDFVAHDVIRPLDVMFGERTLRVLDSGYRWVRVHPTGRGPGALGSALSAMLDGDGVPVQVYVDIHWGEGVGEGGLPWTDDAYLDVIGNWRVEDTHAGRVIETHIIDAEDLDAAVGAGAVTPEQAQAVWAHARDVQAELLGDTYAPLAVLRRYLSDPYT